MAPRLLLLWILLFFDTLRPRENDGSEGAAALCSGFCARSLLSCRKQHWSPFEHCPFSFHWKQIPVPPSTPHNPIRFLITAPVPILPCLASEFRNWSFRSILLFPPWSSICDNQVRLSSDESPMSNTSNTVLSCADSILNLYDPSKMSSDGIYVIDNRMSSHFESNSWISSFRRTIVNRSA